MEKHGSMILKQAISAISTLSDLSISYQKIKCIYFLHSMTKAIFFFSSADTPIENTVASFELAYQKVNAFQVASILSSEIRDFLSSLESKLLFLLGSAAINSSETPYFHLLRNLELAYI